MGCFSSSIFDNIYESDESLLMTDKAGTTPIQSTSPTPPETPHPHPQPKPLGMTDIPIPKGWDDVNCTSEALKTCLAMMAGDRNIPPRDIITARSSNEYVFLFGDDFYSANLTSGEVYKILEPRGKKELWEMIEKDYYGIKCLTLVGNGASDDDSDDDSQ
ncbi:hypothetical protein JVT61DRAFT_1747 [Boletus reticuloceps]|uniref:Uncharacterized protein n=1 Tax=Boletus reticuloceps TaxID=495285 RepID=A0A8I2YPU1_9AGAM|nr:hypothetical protein JVT61DRAFT_1747 [Boletus reticuloceps]